MRNVFGLPRVFLRLLRQDRTSYDVGPIQILSVGLAPYESIVVNALFSRTYC